MHVLLAANAGLLHVILAVSLSTTVFVPSRGTVHEQLAVAVFGSPADRAAVHVLVVVFAVVTSAPPAAMVMLPAGTVNKLAPPILCTSPIPQATGAEPVL